MCVCVSPPSYKLCRRTELHGEGDDEFWDQSFFAEDEDDFEYEAEREEPDYLDEDFFEKEEAEDEQEVVVEKERVGFHQPPLLLMYS